MNYYQHHIGDFNNATRHLSLIERAIYRDLLDMYYDTEKAIDASSIDRLARRLQCTTEEQKEALKYVLDEFFILEEGVYRNNRCEREIAEYHGKKKQASEAGKASAAKRAAKKKGSSNSDSSKDDQASNENSTVVENPLNEEQTDVQPTNNHKPLTINQEPIIDSSSNAREENSQFTLQFNLLSIRSMITSVSMREFISEYSEFQYDFIHLLNKDLFRYLKST
ncbi:YdaU family protein [Acinetobacter baumannii]|nr:YdaU family protein [Acinetobacter baumannii]UQM19540.1 YdaU family protein [Acinetobacter baumannii]